MADYWAHVLVTPDNRAFTLEVSPDLAVEHGISITNDLRPRGWNKTAEGIYFLTLTAGLNIHTMDLIGPYPCAPSQAPSANVSNTQPGQLAADDFASINKAMRNLGIN